MKSKLKNKKHILFYIFWFFFARENTLQNKTKQQKTEGENNIVFFDFNLSRFFSFFLFFVPLFILNGKNTWGGVGLRVWERVFGSQIVSILSWCQNLFLLKSLGNHPTFWNAISAFRFELRKYVSLCGSACFFEIESFCSRHCGESSFFFANVHTSSEILTFF